MGVVNLKIFDNLLLKFVLGIVIVLVHIDGGFFIMLWLDNVHRLAYELLVDSSDSISCSAHWPIHLL